MQYPFNIQNENLNIFPIFGKNKIKNPLFLDLSDQSDWYKNLSNEERKNQKIFQEIISEQNNNLIISGYLEERKRMFTTLGFKQMVEEKRFYHLGIDLTMPVGTKIFCPLEGVVERAEYESGNGNYGGHIILKHEIGETIFYSFYGHLNPKNMPVKNQVFKAGDVLGFLGDFDQNGGYWHHLHLQVITEKGSENNFFDKGYCTKEQILKISEYCPDPTFLFKY